jgi:integrase
MARNRIGYPTVTTHSFHKTVATALDQSGLSAREIAEYLGHANPSLTQDVYMAKNTGGIRAAETINALVSPV